RHTSCSRDWSSDVCSSDLEVFAQPPQAGERCPSVIGVRTVMDRDPNTIASITPFEELIPYYPLNRILMEAPEVHRDISMRAVDRAEERRVGRGRRAWREGA